MTLSALPYFRVPDLAQALERVVELGGSVVHPGERWAICRDSEGSPFGLSFAELVRPRTVTVHRATERVYERAARPVVVPIVSRIAVGAP
jgi:hypothetical protein